MNNREEFVANHSDAEPTFLVAFICVWYCHNPIVFERFAHHSTIDSPSTKHLGGLGGVPFEVAENHIRHDYVTPVAWVTGRKSATVTHKKQA